MKGNKDNKKMCAVITDLLFFTGEMSLLPKDQVECFNKTLNKILSPASGEISFHCCFE